ncbi:MAG TPA: hypothetical protein VJ754_07460 [Anaerolineae bacterium]|nr:hypothetical protein [Anaerolineae bacterium]
MNTDSNQLRLRTVVPWIVVALLISSVPYAIAWASTPDGKVFTGGLVNPDDVSAYIAALRQGADGDWLYQPTFSPETITPRLTYLPYMLAGKLFHIAGGAPTLWFHILRIVAGSLALLGVVFWVRQCLPDQRTQRTAWFLVVFGGGMGWLFVPFLVADPALLPDLYTPEWTTIMALLGLPHFALGLSLQAVLLGCAIRMTTTPRGLRWAIGAALAALGLGLTYPFNILVVVIVIGVYLIVLAARSRRVPWRAWLHGALVLAPLALLSFYYGITSRSDPYWDLLYVANNVIPPPPVGGVLIGFGLIGMLAALGVWRWLQHTNNWLVPIWMIVNLVALYLPVTFSGRFAFGLIVPVATLAAVGLEHVVLPWLQRTRFFDRFARLTPTPYDSLRRIVILLTIPSTLVVVLSTLRTVTVQRDFPYYLPAGELQAVQWLAEHTQKTDLTLAYYPIGNYLPRVIDGKVFLGQRFLTLHLDDKLEMLEQFWHAGASPEWRAAFLREWGITHIYQGQYERGLMMGEVIPPGKIVYQRNGVTIYRVAAP